MRDSRPLGLVVALAPAPEPRFGIIVAVPGGAGADAADLAASLLLPRLAPSSAASASAAAGTAGDSIRVGTPTAAGGYRVEQLPLEEYVARVVAGETSSATPMAAREALAITARTYALANRGRHASDGFDVCTLTHCQVLRPASRASREAATHTHAQILARDTNANANASAEPVPVFYSAACGGRLEDASALLPDTPTGSITWMTARDDPAGVEEPTWQAELSAADLLKALHAAGVRGDTLRDLRLQTNASGRVTAIILTGLTPSTLTADDFRRIVGQRLGWQWLKSLRFTAQRTARGYRFDGRGHGHGVGLCLFGASALARRGKTPTDILQLYFPGLRVMVRRDPMVRREPGSVSTVRDSAASPVATADPAATHAAATTIDVRVPAAVEGERGSLRSLLDRSLRDLGAALDGSTPPARLSLIVYPSGDSYRRATGRPWWTSAATTFDDANARATIHMVPLEGLRRTGRLEATIRHEIVHVLTAPQLRGRPLWVQEGIAAHFAGERPTAPASIAACPADAEFTRATRSDAFQQAYARAAACVARELARGARWDTLR
jgi:SpoIID/LytB domain protein